MSAQIGARLREPPHATQPDGLRPAGTTAPQGAGRPNSAEAATQVTAWVEDRRGREIPGANVAVSGSRQSRAEGRPSKNAAFPIRSSYGLRPGTRTREESGLANKPHMCLELSARKQRDPSWGLICLGSQEGVLTKIPTQLSPL